MRTKRFARIGVVVASVGAAACHGGGAAGAGEPAWTPRIVKAGDERAQLDAVPITERPYRPFHFYGNTVRRLRYRGNPLPTVEDWRNTWRYALRRAG